jgi:HEAT repeat protein
MGKKRRVAIAVMISVVVIGGGAWLALHAYDPLFHGKPESVWVKEISYDENAEQTKLWQSFGPDGVRVLARALEKGNRPLDRWYRNNYQRIVGVLPGFLGRKLPVPNDTSRPIRMCAGALLCRLGPETKAALPAFTRALKDRGEGVRMIALNWFDHRLPDLTEREKHEVLPKLIIGIEDRNSGVRNNTANALGHFPEERGIVVPLLVKALQDESSDVRMCVAESLYHLDPQTAVEAHVVTVVAALLKDKDVPEKAHSGDQIGLRAARLLGQIKREPKVAVPALIECLRGDKIETAITSAEALGEFKEQADVIIPALEMVLNHPDGRVRSRAQGSLAKLKLVSNNQSKSSTSN